MSRALRIFLSPQSPLWSHETRQPICTPSGTMLLSPQEGKQLRFGLGISCLTACLPACQLVFLLSLRVGALQVADPMARGPAPHPPPASIPGGPASFGPRRPARHTLSSAPRCSAVPAVPRHLVTSLSVDETGRAAGLERREPSASPHSGVPAAAPSGPRRACPCGDRRSDGAQKFRGERRGRGSERASACPPPGHAPCPPRNAPAGPRERNACARAPGTQDGSALGGRSYGWAGL